MKMGTNWLFQEICHTLCHFAILETFCFFNLLHVFWQKVLVYFHIQELNICMQKHIDDKCSCRNCQVIQPWGFDFIENWLINSIIHLSLTAILDCTLFQVLLTWNQVWIQQMHLIIGELCARQNGTQCTAVLSSQARGLSPRQQRCRSALQRKFTLC